MLSVADSESQNFNLTGGKLDLSGLGGLVVCTPAMISTTVARGVRGIVLLFSLCLVSTCCAQDLSPRAYTITPVHSNAVILTYSFSKGSILFDPALPISDATGTLNVPIFTYYHGLNFFGRSANVTVSLPYTVGDFQGNVNGTEQNIYRSGLLDSVYRFAVNLKGGPTMSLKEFSSWRQGLLVGASLKVMAPTGQYDPTKLITPGTNRWAFKPEIGMSQRWGHWVLDGYAGVWFFTTNQDFFSRNQGSHEKNTFSQLPMGALEMHLSYDMKPHLWVSIDGNYWYGGRTKVNGVDTSNSLQANSRIGGTVSIPLRRHQSLKFSYSRGAVIRLGGNFQKFSVGWQYSWVGRPR